MTTASPSVLGPSRFGAAPYLVGPKSITHELFEQKDCDSTSWVRGDCLDHGTTRWVRLPCKRRFCPFCGYIRRAKIAARIDLGIVSLAGPKGAGWIVGTWGADIEKPKAVRQVTRLVAWLRRHQARRPEYAITWEQTQRHVLHVNLILAPWRYIPHAELSATWERLTTWPRIYIARVGTDIANEVSKSSRSPGWYFAKREQMVVTGRSCAYSKGWPPLPAPEKLPRQGKILWTPPWALQTDGIETDIFEQELRLGWWRDVAPGWFAHVEHPQCGCFQPATPVAAHAAAPT